MEKIANYINGDLRAPVSRAYIDNAAHTAKNEFTPRSSMPVNKRSGILLRIADGIDKAFEKSAKDENEDNAKPLKLVRAVDIPRASSNMRFFTTAILYFESQLHLTDDVVVNYTKKVKALVARGLSNDDTRIGSLVSEVHMKKVLGCISLAIEERGKILTDGNQVNLPGRCRNGYFVQPAVIAGSDYSCRTDQEDKAIDYAYRTTYGLPATVRTENLKRAHRVLHLLKSGIIRVHCWLIRCLRTPFGDVKQSGVGRERSGDTLRFFTEQKNICIKL